MANFSKNVRRSILSLHVISSALWAGAAISMVVIMFTKNPENIPQLLAYNWALKLIDDWIIIGSGSTSFLTGLLLAWKTPWGFFKYWWVVVKLVLTTGMIILGTAWLGKWTNESVYMVQDHGSSVYRLDKYVSFQYLLKLWASIQIAVLLVVFVVSIFKPWKKL